MRFYEIVLSGAALVAAAWAVELNEVPTSVESGKTYTITWSPKEGTATLKLRQGDPNDLKTLGTLTAAGTGGSYEWTVDSSLPNGDDYAIEIELAGTDPNPNYSGLISLTGSDAEASSSPSASGSSTPSATGYSTATPSSTAKLTTSVVTSTLLSTGTASAGISSSVGSNTTISSPTLSTGAPEGSGASSTGGGPPQETGAASLLSSSPLALFFGAVAAVAYL